MYVRQRQQVIEQILINKKRPVISMIINNYTDIILKLRKNTEMKRLPALCSADTIERLDQEIEELIQLRKYRSIGKGKYTQMFNAVNNIKVGSNIQAGINYFRQLTELTADEESVGGMLLELLKQYVSYFKCYIQISLSFYNYIKKCQSDTKQHLIQHLVRLCRNQIQDIELPCNQDQNIIQLVSYIKQSKRQRTKNRKMKQKLKETKDQLQKLKEDIKRNKQQIKLLLTKQAYQIVIQQISRSAVYDMNGCQTILLDSHISYDNPIDQIKLKQIILANNQQKQPKNSLNIQKLTNIYKDQKVNFVHQKINYQSFYQEYNHRNQKIFKSQMIMCDQKVTNRSQYFQQFKNKIAVNTQIPHPIIIQQQNDIINQRRSNSLIMSRQKYINIIQDLANIKKQLNNLRDFTISEHKHLFNNIQKIMSKQDRKTEEQKLPKFFVGDILMGFTPDHSLVPQHIFTYQQEYRYLISTIEQYTHKRILATRQVYRGLEAKQFHKYIDNWTDYLVLVKLKNNQIIAGYCKYSLLETELQNKKEEKAFITSLTNKIRLDIDNQLHGCRTTTYHPHCIIFGNDQLRINTKDKTVESILGSKATYYRPIMHYSHILGTNDQYSVQYEIYQVYKIYFHDQSVLNQPNYL